MGTCKYTMVRDGCEGGKIVGEKSFEVIGDLRAVARNPRVSRIHGLIVRITPSEQDMDTTRCTGPFCWVKGIGHKGRGSSSKKGRGHHSKNRWSFGFDSFPVEKSIGNLPVIRDIFDHGSRKHHKSKGKGFHLKLEDKFRKFQKRFKHKHDHTRIPVMPPEVQGEIVSWHI